MSAGGWNNHPVIILGGAFGAGVAFALTVAIPLYTTSQQNNFDHKLKEIEDNYSKDRADIANIKGLRRENVYWRKQLSQAELELWQLSDKKPFRSNSPVPVGFEAVQPGLTIEDLRALFPKAEISTNIAGYQFLELPSGLIRKLQLKVRKDHIVNVTYYVMDDERSRRMLYSAVVSVFGAPSRKDSDEDGNLIFYWKIGNREASVYGDQYYIHGTIS